MKLATLAIAALVLSAERAPTLLPLPDGEAGIGFDDLLYVKALDRVLVPGGRTGQLLLVDPRTHALESIAGFTAAASFSGGHGTSTTSADAGNGLIFASDRNRKSLMVVDAKTKAIVQRVGLAGGPDYVRWVAPTQEVWITEPRGKQIELFKLQSGSGPRLIASASITVDDGPESLVVDAQRGRAYTHTWHDQTVVLDLRTHREVGRWRNGCQGARGIALDEERGLLFVGCEEGKAVALDVAHDGKVVGTATAGKGVDIIAYSPTLRHLYVPGGDSATMTVLSVGPTGTLALLATLPTASDAHCVAADATGGVYVCDPKHGRLLLYQDTFGR